MSHDLVHMSLIAFGKGTTVGGALTTTYQAGCVMAYGGAGIVVITLDPVAGFAVAADYTIDFRCNTAGGLQGIVADTTAQVKTVTMQTAAGAATESAFEFKIWRRLTRDA